MAGVLGAISTNSQDILAAARGSFGRATGAAPDLGADTDEVLRDVLGLAPERIAAVRASGAFG